MMKKFLIPLNLIAASLLCPTSSWADYIVTLSFNDAGYGLSSLTIPETVGETNSDWVDQGSVYCYTYADPDSVNSYIELSVNGTLLGDGVTWATSNPGIGIQFKLMPGETMAFTPKYSTEAPNYRMSLGVSDSWSANYIHLRYRLVRLLEKVPAGKITSLPVVTLYGYNPDGKGDAVMSGLILSKISSQPKISACTVDAPTEIKLPTLYGNALQNGAQGVTDSPTIKLTNCPGARDGISYNFSAVYGTYNAANGVLNTATGDGYAQNVYVQVQNADGSAHTVNGNIALSNYDGSGDYDIPDFKVAYYIDDADTVTAGNVKSAIELKLTYN